MKKTSPQLIYSFILSLLITACGGDDSKVKKPIDPVANAGGDVFVFVPETSAELDGSLSTDTDGTINTYSWEKISGPDCTITQSGNVTTGVTGLTEGTYVFQLTVTDDDELFAVDQVSVTVTAEEFYFIGDMNDVTTIIDDGEYEISGWNDLKNHPFVQDFEINNIGGAAYAKQEIVEDPTDPVTNVMHASIINDDPNVSGTTRAQMTLRFEDAVNLEVYHTSHRMYIEDDINFLRKYAGSVVWFTIVELWNKRVAEWAGDPAGSARWNLAILKKTGIDQKLYWRAECEYMQPAREQIWRYENFTVDIPINSWFTLDIYMKRGEGENGNLKFTITPDGGSPQVLFDIKNSTLYPGHPEIPLKSWQAFKLYLDPTYLTYMQNNSKVISAYYSNFKWHKK
jgi:hypothetical protein